MTHFGDCWAGCCSGYPKGPEILWQSCGHHLNYLNQEHVNTHYRRLERQTKMLGSNITKTTRGKEDQQRMMKESREEASEDTVTQGLAVEILVIARPHNSPANRAVCHG